MTNQNNNIETLYNFTKLAVDPMHYSGCYELTGRFGPVNVIDHFASDPKFPKCYLGLLVHDETDSTIYIWFNNTNMFPDRDEEEEKILSFEVCAENHIGYTGSRAKFYFQEDSVKLCFLKKGVPAIYDREAKTPTLVTEIELLMPQLEDFKPITPTSAVDDLKMFGGVTSVNFEHYGTDIRYSTIPNKFNHN